MKQPRYSAASVDICIVIHFFGGSLQYFGPVIGFRYL